MRFFAEYQTKMDNTSRIVIPRRLRSTFGDEGFLTRAFNGKALSLYGQDFHELMEIFISQYEPKVAMDLTRFLAIGTRVTLDNYGRCTIPRLMAQRANLTRDVIIIGVGDHLEIWDADTWNLWDEGNQIRFRDIDTNNTLE